MYIFNNSYSTKLPKYIKYCICGYRIKEKFGKVTYLTKNLSPVFSNFSLYPFTVLQYSTNIEDYNKKYEYFPETS